MKRALVGYSRSETKELLRSLDAQLGDNQKARQAHIDLVRVRLGTVRQRVDELERTVTSEREEERALLATLETLSEVAQLRLRALKARLAAKEQERVVAIATEEARLGGRKDLFRRMRMAIALWCDEVAEMVPLAPLPAEFEATEAARAEVGAADVRDA